MKLKEMSNCVVYCQTEEEYNKLLEIYEKHSDWKWIEGQLPTQYKRWKTYRENTCVEIQKEFGQSPKDWYFGKECGVYSFEEFLKEQRIFNGKRRKFLDGHFYWVKRRKSSDWVPAMYWKDEHSFMYMRKNTCIDRLEESKYFHEIGEEITPPVL